MLCLNLSGGQPPATFSFQPRSPSVVNEGKNLTLQWNYNLGGESVFLGIIANVTVGVGVGAPPNVVIKQQSGDATVQSGYEDRFRAAISDTQATLTILEVPRSETENKYRLSITRTTYFSILTSDDVEIKVLCK